MEIQLGIQSNCSETVYRIPSKFQKLAEDTMEYLVFNTQPTLGYSQMRPIKDTVCYYFYQSDCRELVDFLEKNKIPYDSQCPFGDCFEEWEEIESSEEEKKELREGGSGQFYRRKPYAN